MGEYLKLKIEETAKLIAKETDWEVYPRLIGKKQAFEEALSMFEQFELCGLV